MPIRVVSALLAARPPVVDGVRLPTSTAHGRSVQAHDVSLDLDRKRARDTWHKEIGR